MKIKTLNKKQPDPATSLVLICSTLIHLSSQKSLSKDDKLSLAYLGSMGMIHTAKLARENRRLKSGK